MSDVQVSNGSGFGCLAIVLFIALFWGEPDLLDLLIQYMQKLTN